MIAFCDFEDIWWQLNGIHDPELWPLRGLEKPPLRQVRAMD
jgi:hypothetical protein